MSTDDLIRNESHRFPRVRDLIVQPKFLQLLAALPQPPSPGLAELNLFFELACDAHPALRAIFNDNLVALEKWAAGAAPSLRFSFRTAVDGDWQWSDLGQDEFREDPIAIMMPLDSETMFDDDSDDDDDFFFGEEDGDGDEDSNGEQEEGCF